MKLKQTPISKDDLIKYLDEASDFGFELKILEMLRGKVASLDHGGTYTDPVTKKTREFDIRALVNTEPLRLWLAIECKCVRDYFPVLVSCVPRRQEEAFHEVVLAGVGSERACEEYRVPAMEPKGRTIRIAGDQSIYGPHQWVGKATSQIGRNSSDQIVDNDSEVFDKWSQALCSADELAGRLHDTDNFDAESYRLSALMSVVVVPEGRLWQVHYNTDGTRAGDPIPACRVPCFLAKEYEIDRMTGSYFTMSHLELVTPSGLSELVTQGTTDRLFPQEVIANAVG